MPSKNQAKGLWNELFCRHYGKMKPSDWDRFKCEDCEQKDNCRRKYLRKLRKGIKKYGDMLLIPDEELQ